MCKRFCWDGGLKSHSNRTFSDFLSARLETSSCAFSSLWNACKADSISKSYNIQQRQPCKLINLLHGTYTSVMRGGSCKDHCIQINCHHSSRQNTKFWSKNCLAVSIGWDDDKVSGARFQPTTMCYFHRSVVVNVCAVRSTVTDSNPDH